MSDAKKYKYKSYWKRNKWQGISEFPLINKILNQNYEFVCRYNEIKNSYWNFYFILNNIDRQDFIKKMLDRGVQVGDAYSPPCHNQPVFENYIHNHTFEIADDILSRHISLPMYIELSDSDINLITDIVKEVINDCKE